VLCVLVRLHKDRPDQNVQGDVDLEQRDEQVEGQYVCWPKQEKCVEHIKGPTSVKYVNCYLIIPMMQLPTDGVRSIEKISCSALVWSLNLSLDRIKLNRQFNAITISIRT